MKQRLPGPKLTRREAIAAAIGATAVACCNRSWAAATRLDNAVQIGPFQCRFSGSVDEVIADLEGLRGLEAELRRVLALSPCRETIEVLVLDDSRSHRELIRERHPLAPDRRALFVKQDGQSTVYAYRQRDLAIDLRHECTHALLHSDLPMVPLWLDEGLAEYFEAAPDERPRGPAHLTALRWDLRLGRMLTVEQLEKKHELSELTQLDYRFAWAWAHYMLHGPESATEALWAFLGKLRKSEPPGLLSERLSEDGSSLEARFAAHFRHWPSVLKQAKLAG